MADPQTSTAYSSVASASTSTNYEVFISHRGPDVKKTFAGHLYYRLRSHGLQPFLDKEELRAGEVGSLQIERAIRTASVHIVIFSPGYADSRWCLDELVLIMNKSGDTKIPVFYNVKPSELRWTGRYVEALSNHEQNGRYDRQTLEKWRKALYDISYIIGFELEAHNGDEGKLLDIVVQWVFKKGRKISLNVATYPTDPQEKVEESETTVSTPQRQNRKDKVPRIVGMGGLGKLTTLAKKLFKRPSSNVGKSCLLFDVRENAGRMSLNPLQTKIIKDLTQRHEQIDHVDQGIEMLETHLSTSHHAFCQPHSPSGFKDPVDE